MMTKGRLEAFSDGVLAILITIMVLELKVPHAPEWHALAPLLGVFLSYVLSFVFLGIYWNNHHHLLHAAHGVSAGVLWANLHLLFWLSLIPFTTAWMGENSFAPIPVAAYGAILLCSAFAYLILQHTIIVADGETSHVKRAIGRDSKGKASAILYAIAIPLAFVRTWAAETIYALVAVIWLIPDRRLEAKDASADRDSA
jgi:uncharacterized membrane protein